MSKRTQRRDCPAAGKPIEAFECAIGRHITYNCPETCSFNHFSTQNYDAFLEIEQNADAKFFHWLAEHTPIAAQIAEMNDRMSGDESDSEIFHALAWLAVYRKNPEGDTYLERMSRQGFPGASRDEQLVLRGKMRMRPVIAEVHRILDDRRMEAVDLLDPGRCPFVLVDRALAGVAVRFGIYAMHVFPLPHFYRPYGISHVIPTMPPLDTEEIVREIIHHFGGGVEGASIRSWLMQHHHQFEKSLQAVALARRRAMFNQLNTAS